MRTMTSILAAALMAATVAAQPQVKPAAELAKLGPQVGERAPEFELPDHTGRARTLQSILGPNGAVVVFYRSASW